MNLAPFVRALRALTTDMQNNANSAVADAAATLAATIATRAPVRTGRLRESVRVERGRVPGQLIVKAGGPLTTRETRAGSGQSYDYALATEFGTVNEAAEPFFYPTARELNGRLRERIVDATVKPLKD